MAFYQQRARQEKPPAGVRIEKLPDEHEPASEPDTRRLIGGSLITLLYMTQIAAISQDPWFSRVQSPLDADYVALDLDPGRRHAVLARARRRALGPRRARRSLKVPAVPKTSGSSGLHIYIPLPPHTSYESGMLFCQIVATVVASRHPKVATVERKVKARRRGTVYVDLPAEHPGQDAGDRLQRPRQQLCRRFDAARPGKRSTRRSIRGTSRSRRRRSDSLRSVTSGRACAQRSRRIWRRCSRST